MVRNKTCLTKQLKNESLPSKLFEGRVYRQSLIDPEIAKEFRVSLITFSPGARNVFHTHTNEQVLYVTDGKGIVATEEEEHIVTPGTVILIPAGDRHWHGATKDTSFSHLSIIVTPGETSF